MTRTDLHTLIDTLPESKLPVARAYLEGLRAGAEPSRRSLNEILDAAPYDEDEYTEEELASIDEGIREAESGQTIPLAQVKAEHGLV